MDKPTAITGGNVTAGGNITAVSSCGDGSPSASNPQGSSSISIGASIRNENPATPSTHAVHISTSSPQAQTPDTVNVHAPVLPQLQSILAPYTIEPLRHPAGVWSKTLEIVEKKLLKHKLPPLINTIPTSQSARENIRAVVGALNTFQKDEEKKQWSYTWRGKEVVIVDHVGKILKTMEPYSKIVDTAIQSNPEVTSLVWGGVRAIMQVCNSVSMPTH